MLPFTLDADLKPQETPFIHWDFQSFMVSSALQKICKYVDIQEPNSSSVGCTYMP